MMTAPSKARINLNLIATNALSRSVNISSKLVETLISPQQNANQRFRRKDIYQILLLSSPWIVISYNQKSLTAQLRHAEAKRQIFPLTQNLRKALLRKRGDPIPFKPPSQRQTKRSRERIPPQPLLGKGKPTQRLFWDSNSMCCVSPARESWILP